MSMVKWIDIVSPDLRGVHQLWCDLRNSSLIPHLKQYNAFIVSVDESASLSAVFPANRVPPAFRSVGAALRRDYPTLRSGMSFTDVQPLVTRTLLTVPFHETCANRQPECRRGSVRLQSGERRYEQLLLPFGDDRLRVCLVHALYDYPAGR